MGNNFHAAVINNVITRHISRMHERTLKISSRWSTLTERGWELRSNLVLRNYRTNPFHELA